LKRDCGQRT